MRDRQSQLPLFGGIDDSPDRFPLVLVEGALRS